MLVSNSLHEEWTYGIHVCNESQPQRHTVYNADVDILPV